MTEPVVRVRDVFVAFGGGAGPVMALRGADLTLGAGERLLIQGPNGSGKSTLLRVITGEQSVVAGSVDVAGTPLHELDARRRREWRARSVGFIDQHARRGLLPEQSVLDNVSLQLRLAGLSRRSADDRARQALDLLELSDLADRAVSELSGGEAQRVATCAAVAHGPQLVLADEPTGELDEESARQVYDLLARIAAQGTGIILVSHDPRSVRFADRAIRIRDGRAAEQWHPGREDTEQLTDSRGWIRMPTELLDDDRELTAVVARPVQGGLALTPRWRPGGRPTGAETPSRRPALDREPGRLDVPVVEAVQLSAGFGRRALFTGLDLALYPASWTVVSGPSGSGKSTLLSLVSGLSAPLNGQIRVGGTDWATLSRDERSRWRRDWLSLTPQRAALVEALTVRENLTLTAEVRGIDPDRWSGLVTDLGLARLVDQPVSGLSGGERQRVSLARSLLSAAPVLVLDEPTSQQDDTSAERVVEALLAEAAAGRAVLVASHDPRLLTRADTEVSLGAHRAGQTVSRSR